MFDNNNKNSTKKYSYLYFTAHREVQILSNNMN